MKIIETTAVRSQSLPTLSKIENSSTSFSHLPIQRELNDSLINFCSNKQEHEIDNTKTILQTKESSLLVPTINNCDNLKAESNVTTKSTTMFMSDSDILQQSRNISVPMAERGRLMAFKQTRSRLVEKSGESNISLVNVTKRKRKFMVDFMTTIMELKWRFHVLLFIICFVLSWILFGLAWYLVALVNGDLSPEKVDLCVMNVKDFSSALLFSVETQATIGYGYRYVNSDCAFGTFLVMAQSCFGIFITCFATGIIFGKISRPKRRSQTIMFSKNAVVCKRDGEFYFQFRVGDIRKAHIIGTSIRAIFVKQRRTENNEIIPLCQYPLEIETETSKIDSFIFFLWPVTITHRINKTSPFWEMSAEDVLLNHFEVVVIMEGTVPTNGSLIQVRTSYLPTEIKWGQNLTPLITVETFDGDCVIDYSKFNETTPITMVECSAADYAMRKYLGTLNETEEHNFPVSFSAPAVRLQEMSPKIFKALENSLLFKPPINHKKTKIKNKNSLKIKNAKYRSKLNAVNDLSFTEFTKKKNGNKSEAGKNNVDATYI